MLNGIVMLHRMHEMLGWVRWAKSRGPPSEGAPEFQFQDKVTKRRRGKERVEWGRGPWRAVFAFLPRGLRVPSYATVLAMLRSMFPASVSLSVCLSVTRLCCAETFELVDVASGVNTPGGQRTCC